MAINREPVESPLWWVNRLWAQLQVRIPIITVFNDYYDGEPPRVPWLPEQARPYFKRLLHLTKSNYMGLVVDALAERCTADGFRIGESEVADKDTQRIWQANHLDSDSDKAILEAIIHGASYMLVEPNLVDRKTPKIYVEHPSQAIVEYVPGSGGRDRAAGLKVWFDDWTGEVMATLYLPTEIYKFKAPAKSASTGRAPRWEKREVKAETWPLKNQLGAVPLVEIPNNPRLVVDPKTGMMGRSELGDVISIQDRIAKTIADRLMTQDFGAFPQKWATGFPDKDPAGNTNKIDVGQDRMVSTDVITAKFGQFEGTPLAPYGEMKREDVKDIASRTRTPAQYLLGELNNVNGSTLQAAESGLVSKARQRMRGYGEGKETVVLLARSAAGLKTKGAIETLWRNPMFRNEGEMVDALTKLQTLRIPEKALWELYGATPTTIERWEKMAEEQAKRDPALQVAAALGGTAPAGVPDEPE